MKIVGFSQLRNERDKGNLEHWLKCMSLCDAVYIYDHASDDGSQELYKQAAEYQKVVVIQAPKNMFTQELICKASLMDQLKANEPDADWVWWMDGDTLMDGRLLDETILRDMLSNHMDADGIRMGHYNLWRSDVWYRVDSAYHGFHTTGRVPFWRFPKIRNFPRNPGLHSGANEFPRGIDAQRIARPMDYSLIHRGFATDAQILTKYHLYKGYGQRGWDLDRLIDEETLEVARIPMEILPEWFEVVDDTDPTMKLKLKELM